MNFGRSQVSATERLIRDERLVTARHCFDALRWAIEDSLRLMRWDV